MNEDYVSYSQAVKLKELGFDWKCRRYYNTNTRQFLRDRGKFNHNLDWVKISAPRLDQAQKWLREKKGVDIEIVCLLNIAKMTRSYKANLCYFSKDENGEDCANYKMVDCNIQSYERALELGISKTLELLTKNKLNEI